MKLLKNTIFSSAVKFGHFFKLYPAFLVLFYVVMITGFWSSFFEDQLYIAKAESIMKDGDYNIINQVNNKFNWLVTQEYFHPSHHTENQTPSIVVLRYVEMFWDLFFEYKFLEEFLLASLTISLFSLYYGFKFCTQILEKFGERDFLSPFVVFFTSSVFLYFSICYLNVSEIFSFPLTAYILKTVLLKERIISIRDILCFSLCSVILLISKSIYLFPYLISSYYIFLRNKNLRASVLFSTTSLIIVGTYYLNMYDQFGGIELLGKSASVFLDFSFFNFFNTFFSGFRVGGMFVSNPSYIPALIFSLLFIYKLYISKYDTFILLMLLAWLGGSFSQTIFIIGDIFNDQFPGRLVLTSLPIILIGFFYFYKSIKNKWLRISVSGVFIFLHVFSLVNYLAIDKKGHYAYATQKVINNFGELKELIDVALFKVEIANYNFHFIVLWSLTFYIIFKLFKNNLFFVSQLITGTLLVVFSLMSLSNSESNTREFFEENEKLRENVVIGSSGEVYFYNHINDSLEFRMRGARSTEIKDEIVRRRKDYYDIIKKNLMKSTPEFNNILDNYIFDYGYFKEDDYN